MLKFNPELLVLKYEMLSSITTALGGSIRLSTYDDNDNEVIKRYEIPFKVARHWKETYKVTRYMVAIPVAVVYYDGMVVMVEKGPALAAYILNDPEQYGTLFDEPGKLFTAHCEHTISYIKKNLIENWYTDGTMIYQLPVDQVEAFNQAESLTADGTFRSIEVLSVAFSELTLKANIENPATHTITMIRNASGSIFTAPPIFKNIAEMRNSSLATDEGKNDTLRFDLINSMFSVNMEFALNAGKVIGSVFGYKAVSPLGLPQLMVALTTVNLPKIRTSIRSTYPMGMTFLQAYAWLTGLINSTDNLDDVIKIRGTMKFLCQKGIFKSNTMKRIFRKDSEGNVVTYIPELLSRDQLDTHVENQTEAQRISTMEVILRTPKQSTNNPTVVTGIQMN